MIKKILTGYSKLLISLAKILLVVCFCALCAFVVVFPLWKCATVAPEIYSVVVLTLFAVGIILFFALRFKKGLQMAENKAEKTKFIKKTALTFAKLIVLVGGLYLFCSFVLKSKYIFSIIFVILTIILYGILSFSTDKKSK